MQIQTNKINETFQSHIKYHFLAVVFACLTFGVFKENISAVLNGYVGSGYFPTNQIIRCHYGDWNSVAQTASAIWSSSTDLDVYTGCSNVKIVTNGYNAGPDGYWGASSICSQVVGCGLGSINYPYINCYTRLNSYYLNSGNYADQLNTALHEFGHCLSLDHSNRSTSVMNINQSNTSPDAAEVIQINYRY